MKGGSGVRLDTRSLDQRFAHLDKLSRTRRLDDRESLELERVVREIDARDTRRKRQAGHA